MFVTYFYDETLGVKQRKNNFIFFILHQQQQIVRLRRNQRFTTWSTKQYHVVAYHIENYVIHSQGRYKWPEFRQGYLN